MDIDYIKIEQTFNRVNAAMKSIADKATLEDLQSIGYMVAELRHASMCYKEGTSIHDIEERLIKNLLF